MNNSLKAYLFLKTYIPPPTSTKPVLITIEMTLHIVCLKEYYKFPNYSIYNDLGLIMMETVRDTLKLIFSSIKLYIYTPTIGV